MSQTLKQKRHRKRKKIAKKNKARVGKVVIFTDRVRDAKKQAARTRRLVEQYKTPSYYW